MEPYKLQMAEPLEPNILPVIVQQNVMSNCLVGFITYQLYIIEQKFKQQSHSLARLSNLSCVDPILLVVANETGEHTWHTYFL